MASPQALPCFSPSFPLDVVLGFCEAPALFAFDATCRQARAAVTQALRMLVLRTLPLSQHSLLRQEQPWREMHRSMHSSAPSMHWSAAPSLDRPRFAHSSVVYKNHVVIFGGRHGPDYLNDVATLSLRTLEWLPDVTRGPRPSPKRAHSAVVLGRHMYILGGGSDELPGTDEMHALDLELLTWRPLSSPPGWSYLGHTCVPAGESRLVVFGGCWWGDEFKVTDELREYDTATDTWTSPAAVGARPCARYRHSMVSLPGRERGADGSPSHGHVCVLYGGYVTTWRDGCPRLDGSWSYNRCDMLTLDTRTYTWAKVKLRGQEPLARGAHSCVVLGSERLLFFGGGILCFDGVDHVEEDCGEMFAVDTRTWSFEAVEPAPGPCAAGTPSARGSHTAVVAACAGTLGVLVLGGRDYNSGGSAEHEIHRGRSDCWMLACADRAAPDMPVAIPKPHDATAAGS